MNRRDLLKTSFALLAAPEWKPVFFDAHQNETVIALTDLIIPATDTPGAKVALVNRFIDLVLSDSGVEQQTRFLRGLAWLGSYDRHTHGVPFVRCTAQQQTALLEALDPDRRPPDNLRPGVRFFRDIKRRTVAGYYSSKIGFDELNKGGRVPKSFGCPHGEHTA